MPTKAVKHPLPYFPDSASLFSPDAIRPWAVFLDSAHPISGQGRFDILAYDPVCTLETWGDETVIRDATGESVSEDDPFRLLQQKLGTVLPGAGDLPFNGGAIGYFGYDLVRRIEKLPALAEDAEQMAEMAVGIYRWAVVVDHLAQASWLVVCGLSDERVSALIERFSHLPPAVRDGEFKVLGEPQPNMSRQAYNQAFADRKSVV